MANYVKINKDGDLEISGKVVNIEKIVYRDDDGNIVDIDGNDLLAENDNYATGDELQAVADKADANETAIGERPTKAEMDAEYILRPKKNEVFLKEDLDNIKTPTPDFDIDDSVGEGDTVEITVSDYDSNTVYEFMPDDGKVEHDSDAKFIFTAPSVDEDTVINIKLTAVKEAHLRSDSAVKSINVLDVTVAEDTALVNNNFADNENYEHADGVEF